MTTTSLSATHPPAMKVGGRRLSVSFRPKHAATTPTICLTILTNHPLSRYGCLQHITSHLYTLSVVMTRRTRRFLNSEPKNKHGRLLAPYRNTPLTSEVSLIVYP
ncbi:hypothetical protein H2248_001539 [Termitomyces sp. 'cryptogamus']|nr:hypothetical protein H2248_001539 [Termitomyces sp. 'cryptogamus']